MTSVSTHDWLAHEHADHSCACTKKHAEKRDWLSIAILAGGGTYFLQLIRTGDLANYVNVRFAWIVWIGMFAFFLLAFAKLTPSVHQHDHGCSGKRSAWKLWLLAVPVALGLFLPSTPLNSSVIQSTSPDLQAILKEQVGLQYLLTPEAVPDRSELYSLYNDVMPDTQHSYDDPLSFTLLDWFRLYVDLPNEKKELLEGMPVEVVGFVYHGQGVSNDRFLVTRFFMRHCMFDTVPIGIPVVSKNAGAMKEDSWVKVQGRMEYLPDASGKNVLTIVGESVRLTEQPKTPYLYPDASVQ